MPGVELGVSPLSAQGHSPAGAPLPCVPPAASLPDGAAPIPGPNRASLVRRERPPPTGISAPTDWLTPSVATQRNLLQLGS